MTCYRCGRFLKRPTETGFGPKCERTVLGPRKRKSEPKPAKRDDLTADLFPEALQLATRVHAVLSLISLEMNHG